MYLTAHTIPLNSGPVDTKKRRKKRQNEERDWISRMLTKKVRRRVITRSIFRCICILVVNLVNLNKFISSAFLVNGWIIETTFSFIFGRRNGEKEKEVEKWAKELNVVLKACSEVENLAWPGWLEAAGGKVVISSLVIFWSVADNERMAISVET